MLTKDQINNLIHLAALHQRFVKHELGNNNISLLHNIVNAKSFLDSSMFTMTDIYVNPINQPIMSQTLSNCLYNNNGLLYGAMIHYSDDVPKDAIVLLDSSQHNMLLSNPNATAVIKLYNV